ncbi:hypothetical protein [Streptomyces sp. NPDC048560]|uniref:hypothetical protein n=1 Tax=Streptomyces sp. NPDC048560 TaxID=3155488 RepID=UPI003417E8D6
MGTSLSRTFSAALTASLAAALLAGCGSLSGGRSAKATDVPATPAEISEITTAVIEPVPVEAYLLTEEQWTMLGRAEHALRVRCMERFGFPYEEPLPVGEPSGQTISQYRYGKLDPAKTAVHGYRMPGAPSSAGGTDAGATTAKERRKKPTAAERMVLSGTADLTAKSGRGGQNVNGGTVPDGGCVGEAQRKLGDYGDAQIANDVNLGSFGKSLQDGRVIAVFAKWSRCMAESGYHYQTPMEASEDEKWLGETASAEEKTVATADALCKIKNNVAGVWYAVDVAYQKQAIEEHAEELDQVRKGIDGQLKAAAEVLGD